MKSLFLILLLIPAFAFGDPDGTFKFGKTLLEIHPQGTINADNAFVALAKDKPYTVTKTGGFFGNGDEIQAFLVGQVLIFVYEDAATAIQFADDDTGVWVSYKQTGDVKRVK